MSMGTVVPHVGDNCIANVMVRNIKFNHPFKAIYIKTNPGEEGSGTIKNITYENIDIDTPIWWGIYIGPQQ
jgi:polygalacturonase